MDAALKAIVLPHLRAMGFAGSMPHLHRPRGDAIDLISFRFDRYGGGLFIILARMPKDGFMSAQGFIDPRHGRAEFMRERHRLGAPLELNWKDHQFRFAAQDPKELAREICSLLDCTELWRLIERLSLQPE